MSAEDPKELKELLYKSGLNLARLLGGFRKELRRKALTTLIEARGELISGALITKALVVSRSASHRVKPTYVV